MSGEGDVLPSDPEPIVTPQATSGRRELPVFVLWIDFTGWMLDATGKFPKNARYTFASRIDTLLLDVIDDLVEARYTKHPIEPLRRANLRLERLRILLRLAHGRRYLATNAYEHASRRIDEAGRMLGGWRKSQNREAV